MVELWAQILFTALDELQVFSVSSLCFFLSHIHKPAQRITLWRATCSMQMAMQYLCSHFILLHPLLPLAQPTAQVFVPAVRSKYFTHSSATIFTFVALTPKNLLVKRPNTTPFILFLSLFHSFLCTLWYVLVCYYFTTCSNLDCGAVIMIFFSNFRAHGTRGGAKRNTVLSSWDQWQRDSGSKS